jgi:hypothetical protein
MTYANVVATLALVFAMSGGALAANHYLINSTKQINPKVLKKLEGNIGRRGSTGHIGPVGPQGVGGPPGPKGSRGERGLEGPDGFSAFSRLPSGKSESGEYAMREPSVETGKTVEEAISLPIPLETAIPTTPTNHVIYATIANAIAQSVPHCSGPGHADAGYLCIYSAESAGVEGEPTVVDPEESPVGTKGTGVYGFALTWDTNATSPFDVGTYTVTAP